MVRITSVCRMLRAPEAAEFAAAAPSGAAMLQVVAAHESLSLIAQSRAGPVVRSYAVRYHGPEGLWHLALLKPADLLR